MGMSTGKVPAVYDGTLADEVLTVNFENSMETIKALSYNEGMLVGTLIWAGCCCFRLL